MRFYGYMLGRKMSKIIIDSKNLDVEEGITILQAALQSGIYIPHICHHPDLKPSGSCRLCIVEIEGFRGYPVSCATAVKDGMVIKTNTSEIKRIRKNLIWLLLSNYHGEPPSDTLLKKVVDYIGVSNFQIELEKKPRNLPIKSDDPLFTMDQNLCILCERCVRICHDVRGAGIVGYINKGIHTVVSTAYDSSFKDADCRFCRACVEVCPSGALSDKKPFPEHERDLKLLPCKNTCPAGIDIPRYLKLTAEGRYQDAVEVIRETVPFPHVLGLTCTHPCEKVCLRAEINEPIAINPVKRFLAEQDNKRWINKLKIAPDTGKNIAIIGSGPSGLTAAWFLRLLGHSITIFEKQPKVGGAMRLIPDYRLPKSILDKEINEILSIGIDIKTNTRIDSPRRLLKKGFHAVYISIGASKALKMGIPGEDSSRVLNGLAVLNSLSYRNSVDFSGDVIVVGGGSVAVDTARSLVRKTTGSITILYRRTMGEMTAHPEELIAALKEGVMVQFLVTPVKIISVGDKLHIECLKMQLLESNQGGRKKPVPVMGSEFTIETDYLVMAVGQTPEISAEINIDTDKKGLIIVNDEMATSHPGIYAGGDVVRGSSNIIISIQEGRKAAQSIDKFLGGSGKIGQRLIPEKIDNPWMGREEGFCYQSRAKMPEKDVSAVISDFGLIELGYDEKLVRHESKRCLRCHLRLAITKTNHLIRR